ncbi:MAG: VOC family protein [Gammaproteobacteria bacterium]|nr:VOC family protein [Gammaproteobacteria bacterium]
MGIQHITHVSVYVRDQDEALIWYTRKLGFKVCDDNSDLVPGFRWLTISPPGDDSTRIVLMPVCEERDEVRIGNNGMCVLATDNCREDSRILEKRGVKIVDPPTDLPWGISAIISDLYGNPYNLVEVGKG